MFNHMNPHIFMALCTFMLVVKVGTVQRGIRLKYSNIKERRLEPTTPKARGLNILKQALTSQLQRTGMEGKQLEGRA